MTRLLLENTLLGWVMITLISKWRMSWSSEPVKRELLSTHIQWTYPVCPLRSRTHFPVCNFQKKRKKKEHEMRFQMFLVLNEVGSEMRWKRHRIRKEEKRRILHPTFKSCCCTLLSQAPQYTKPFTTHIQWTGVRVAITARQCSSWFLFEKKKKMWTWVLYGVGNREDKSRE